MSHTHVELRDAYADSVVLLEVSKAVAATPGVLDAQVAMGTPLNVEVLTGMGFEVPPCSPNTMVVALRVGSEEEVPAALAAVDAALAAGRRDSSGSSGSDGPSAVLPRTTGRALRRTGSTLALVSVPGEHATAEAVDALDAGADVLVFSDNVPVEQEVALKRLATERGRLVMGPDCGTAVVDGVGLGFANVVPPGDVALVAASGTGAQQLMCLLAAAGVGVGDVLGVGGRDLSEEVGGLSTLEALRRLDADPGVRRIVLVSKPPAPAVAARVEEHAAGLSTPVDLALLGPGRPDLTAVAESVVAALGGTAPTWPVRGTARPARGGHLRGLFVGGTLCDEAMIIAAGRLGPIRSNIPLSPELALGPDLQSDGHLMVDFGDDRLTQGRAHPMIDPTLRLEQLARFGADPATGVLLLDVVLGHAAEPDPAALLAPAIAAVDVPVVVACVGTTADPQGLDRQAEALAGAGAEVHLSNAAAARRAAELAGGAA
ncbi:FdrA family protein [Nocardioides caldifontis]|uniref:FdrA family protein n=1 Tax=Nocardioides caldifontis TaxID=2588938 RepID=UPI0011E052E0|nr:FdrA family protein [Nocardioides caldifontis]